MPKLFLTAFKTKDSLNITQPSKACLIPEGEPGQVDLTEHPSNLFNDAIELHLTHEAQFLTAQRE